jgi:hypothetical protein
MRQRSRDFLGKGQLLSLITAALWFSFASHAQAQSSITFVGAGPLASYGSPVSNVAVSLPAGVQAGDCLLAQIVVYDPNGSNVPTSPSGWSLVRADAVNAGYKMTSWIYYKIAGNSEPASYSWNISNQYVAGVMGGWRGTSAQPIDRSSGAIAAGPTPLSDMAPALTPSANGELQAYFYGAQGDTKPTLKLSPSITTRSNTTSPVEGFVLAFADLAAPAAGRASSIYSVTVKGGGAATAQAVLLIPANGAGSTPIATPTTTPTVVATPVPPAVILISPQSASMVSGTVQVVTQVAPSVSSINLYLDSNMLAQSAPLTYNWNTIGAANGAHILSVQAYNASNVMLGTNAINVTINNSVSTSTPTPTVKTTPTRTATATPTRTATPTATATIIADPLRPSNNIPNNRVPTAAELSTFHSGAGGCGGLDDCAYMQEVTGDFVGTTAQIMQQVADKWCPNCTILNPYDGLTYSFAQLLKAIAVNETHWYQWRTANLTSPDPVTGLLTLTPSHGDLEHVTQSEPFGGSWGLFQIAEGVNQGWPASFPLSALSTGFNADFKVGVQMGVEQGHLDYLSDASRAELAIANGYAPYTNFRDSNGVMHLASTDLNQRRWGAVGNWYSGGWYDSGAINYIQQVQQYLHSQPWQQAGF